MKPSYPELLKAFKFSCNQKNSKEGQEYIGQIIERLVLSEDWKKEEIAVKRDEDTHLGYSYSSSDSPIDTGHFYPERY
jgi:hypothetical protein